MDSSGGRAWLVKNVFVIFIRNSFTIDFEDRICGNDVICGKS
jgi:hypothetical protein